MLNAGSDMSASDYGQCLLIMGDYENRIGESEHRMIKSAFNKFVKPFMDAASKEGAINVSRLRARLRNLIINIYFKRQISKILDRS